MRDIIDVRTKHSHYDGYRVDICSVPCPKCGALAGDRCISESQSPTSCHTARYKPARIAAGMVQGAVCTFHSKRLIACRCKNRLWRKKETDHGEERT